MSEYREKKNFNYFEIAYLRLLYEYGTHKADMGDDRAYMNELINNIVLRDRTVSPYRDDVTLTSPNGIEIAPLTDKRMSDYFLFSNYDLNVNVYNDPHTAIFIANRNSLEIAYKLVRDYEAYGYDMTLQNRFSRLLNEGNLGYIIDDLNVRLDGSYSSILAKPDFDLEIYAPRIIELAKSDSSILAEMSINDSELTHTDVSNGRKVGFKENCERAIAKYADAKDIEPNADEIIEALSDVGLDMEEYGQLYINGMPLPIITNVYDIKDIKDAKIGVDIHTPSTFYNTVHKLDGKKVVISDSEIDDTEHLSRFDKTDIANIDDIDNLYNFIETEHSLHIKFYGDTIGEYIDFNDKLNFEVKDNAYEEESEYEIA